MLKRHNDVVIRRLDERTLMASLRVPYHRAFFSHLLSRLPYARGLCVFGWRESNVELSVSQTRAIALSQLAYFSSGCRNKNFQKDSLLMTPKKQAFIASVRQCGFCDKSADDTDIVTSQYLAYFCRPSKSEVTNTTAATMC